MILDLTSEPLFKVIGDFQGQSYTKNAISALSWPVDTQYILPSYRKSWSRNPLVILDLTCDLSFKIISDFQGQSYTKHVISALLLPVETQYVLTSYRNPLVILDLTSDLSFKVIGAFQGQSYIKHAISA